MAVGLMAVVSVSCGHGNQGDSDGDTVVPQADEYHADNDIAMTVRSLADAIRVGEKLDSADYDFEGVLTDGQGSPLYTDVQGAPGMWRVDVVNPATVVVRNLYLGDLLPSELEVYLLGSLGLDESNRVDIKDEMVELDDETTAVVYDIEGGYMRYEIRAGIAPNGLEGPLVNIILTSRPLEEL